jgi:hypothetical protein
MKGGCTCGAVRYELTTQPMIVHCCHCRWCQRETGSAFVINALIESARLHVEGAVELVMTPSESGEGQEIARCPECRIALWSHYPTAGRRSSFVRVGTLDDPAACPPDVHIFTRSKQPWVGLPTDTSIFADFYPSREKVWSAAAMERWRAMMAS